MPWKNTARNRKNRCGVEWPAALRAARKAAGCQHKDAAAVTSLSVETLWQYEAGKRRPNKASLMSMLLLYKLSAEQQAVIITAWEEKR